MIKLISGGDYAKDGYSYNIAMYFPEFTNDTTINMMRNKHTSLKINFPSYFQLTNNNIYCNIVFRLFGFGLGLEIQSKT